MCLYERVSKKSWKQSVGVQGIWTVRYTHDWIVEKFIPKVLSHYRVQFRMDQHSQHRAQEWLAEKFVPHIFFGYKTLEQKQREAQQKAILEKTILSNAQKGNPPLSEASELKHLAAYLHDVQSWLIHYQTRKIAVSLLRPYYTTFTELLRAVNPTPVNIGYIAEKLGYVECKTRERLRREELSAEEEQAVYLGLSTVEGILECLKSHVQRIHKAEYEFTDFAELISRVFISIAQDGNGYVAQDQLNNAKQVLLPLWEQSRFDERFIRFLPE